MKKHLSERDLGEMGITQECLQSLANVGALPDLIETTEGPAIPLAEFGKLFEHLAMSFCMIRASMLAAHRARVGTGGVDFAPESSEVEVVDCQAILDKIKADSVGIDSEIIAGRHECKFYGPMVAVTQVGCDGCAGCFYIGEGREETREGCPRTESGRLACGEIDKVWIKADQADGTGTISMEDSK